ncbi:MAG: hypothetical protein PHX43_02155 [Alphaproteobacteria bacterium]|nr:hypothetical protein [Alphaproteobacteria bacterium]
MLSKSGSGVNDAGQRECIAAAGARAFALRLACLFLLFGCGTFCLTANSAFAATSVSTRAGVHENYERLVFDWPRSVTYKISREGTHVSIMFKSSGEINLRPLQSSKLTRAKNFTIADNAPDSLSVSFEVPKDATLKDFTSGTAIVIDLFGAAGPAPVAEQKTPTKPKAKAPPTAVKEEPKPAEKKEETPPTNGDAKALLVVSPPKTAQELAAMVIAETQPILVKSTATGALDKLQEIAASASPAPVMEQTATASSIMATTSTPVKTLVPIYTRPAINQPAGTLEVGTIPELVLSLNPKVEIGSAVFSRSGYGYIIFDRKLTLDLTALTDGQPAPRVALEPLDLPNNNGYRFSLPKGVELRANRSGTTWQVFLSKQWRDNPVSGALIAQPDFALGSRLLLPAIEPPEPVRFTDPVVGDEIIALPLKQVDAFSVYRRYAELELVPSAQGLAIKPWIEKLIVNKVSDGIEITTINGLTLSPATDTGMFERSPSKVKASYSGKMFFDFAAWAGKRDEDFTTARQRLMQTVVEVRETERNRARLELARFYFAHGMGEECQALLKFLNQEDPDLKNYPEFQALSGASKILSGRAVEGLIDLSKPEIRFQPEIKLWQAVGAVQQRDWQNAEEKFAITQNILSNYPEPFFSKFYVLAIEAALAVNRDSEAAEWLAQIDMQPHRPEVDPALNYLRGVIHSKAGRQIMAEDLWKQVMRSHDRLYKIRAKLALIDLGVATKSLTPAQAADQLESMRFVWRGDELELDILHRLGLFYLEAKNIKSALSVMTQATRLFPNSSVTPQIKSEMADAFLNSFIGENVSPLSPLEALSLYQLFGELMPPGDTRTNVIRNLAERLVSIDLLDQASTLLEGLVKDVLQGEDKARASTRLAAIRLIDHKADAALSALGMVGEAGLPSDIVKERQLLRARALSEQGKEDDALALLQNDDSKPAKMLRADITMKSHRWAEAARILLDLIGPAPATGSPVTFEQAQWLVNCAIALAMSGDAASLDRIAADYGPSMVGSPQNDTFRILTRPERAGQLRDIATAQNKITEVDLFRSFLDSYRTPPKK